MKKYLCILMLAFAPVLPVPAGHASDIQYMGIVPFYAPEKIWGLYAPLIEHLNKTTGIRWELKLYHNHDAIIDGFCRSEVAVAFLGPVPFGRAQERCRIRPLLVALGSDGKPEYSAVIITSDSEVRALGDVRGKKFGFFEGSTAAYVLPRKLLEDEGIVMSAIKPVFMKGQDKIMDAVVKHEITAAGVKESLYKKFRGTDIRMLKISEPVPNFVFCASPVLPQRVEKKFIESLRRLQPRTNPDDRRTVQAWDEEIKHGFILPPGNYEEDCRRLTALYHKYSR